MVEDNYVGWMFYDCVGCKLFFICYNCLVQMVDQQVWFLCFKVLYDGLGVFVMFNLWDVGLVWLLVSFGFDVLVMISVGLVFFKGCCDGVMMCDQILINVVQIVVVMDLLVLVDFENGFGILFEVCVQIVWLVCDIGLVGGLIEDVMGDFDVLIYDLLLVVECVQVVVEVVDGLLFLLMVWVENFLWDWFDLDDMICWL